MLKVWVTILNTLSAIEFRIADKIGEMAAIVFHFSIFWMLPIALVYIPSLIFTGIGMALALFYVYVLAGDIFLSVFGHEKLEKKRGMIDIVNVQEMKEDQHERTYKIR